jgi:hypothetical protein
MASGARGRGSCETGGALVTGDKLGELLKLKAGPWLHGLRVATATLGPGQGTRPLNVRAFLTLQKIAAETRA